MVNNQVTLFDISFWQDDDYTQYKVDFVAMKYNGGDGVILRAGQNTWNDPDFEDYARNADKINFPWGAYWFYDSRSNPIFQADKFCDLVQSVGTPKLGLWGDYEEKYGGVYGGERNYLTFLERIRQRFPNTLVGVYTGPSYWIEHTTQDFRPSFKDYPLWIANYDVSSPAIPSPWTQYVLWQYTDKGDGYLYGAESSRIDMNIFRGTLDDYKRYFLLELGNGEPMPTHYYKVIPTVSNEYRSIRAQNVPHIDGTKVAQINAGNTGKAFVGSEYTYIYGQDYISNGVVKAKAGDKWIRMFEANGVGVNGWIAEIHLGRRYINLEEIGAPSPDPEPEPELTYTIEVYNNGSIKINGDPYL